MTPAPSILLMADDERRLRYPARLWAGDTLIELTSEPSSGSHLARVVDSQVVPTTVPQTGPIMVSLDVLAGLVEQREFPLVAGQWLPLLPADLSADIRVARHQIADGAIGTARMIDITVPVGPPPSGEWEADHVTALSSLEAIVFGVRVAELIADAEVMTSTWLVDDPTVRTVVHSLDTGAQVVHHIVPAHSTAATAFEGVVLGDGGRLTLRAPFAPGSVGVRNMRRPGYTFPAVQEAKHDVQAPDSVVGGWEMAGLLSELVAPGTRATELSESAVRLVRHALQFLPGGNDDH